MRNYTAEAELVSLCQLQSAAMQQDVAKMQAQAAEILRLREDNMILRREYADLRAEMDNVEETA
jgi:cell division protein FtsB